MDPLKDDEVVVIVPPPIRITALTKLLGVLEDAFGESTQDVREGRLHVFLNIPD